MRGAVAAGLALVLAGASCSLLLEFDPDALREDTAERCTDGVDNDENGLVDCAEPGCALFSFCQETSAEACRDRLDNDRDGLVDCLDPGCLGQPDCDESLGGRCTNGVDDGGNGLEDCQDFTCRAEPACCTAVGVTWAATDLAPPAEVVTCLPPACDAATHGEACNAFGPGWISLGAPAARTGPDGSGLDPNQCAACFAAGDCAPCRPAVLVSRATLAIRAGLEVAAVLELGGEAWDRAGVALTWQTQLPEPGPCVEGEPGLDAVVGVSLARDASGLPVLALGVDTERMISRDVPPGPVVVALRLDPDRFAEVHLAPALDVSPPRDAVPILRSTRPVTGEGPPARVALLGSGSGVRVAGLEVRDLARCADPVPRPALIDASGVALPASAVAWSRGVVGDPAVVEWQGERHLYFTGQTTIDGPRSIGHARWSDPGPGAGAWVVEPPDRPILGPGSGDAAWDEEIDLTGPAPVVLPDGRLVLYASLGDPADADGVRHTSLVGASSEEGVTFMPLAGTSITPAGRPGVVLEPVLQPAAASDDRPSWERALRDPVVVVRDATDLVMLYVGRADPLDPFTGQIGLARSADGFTFERDHVVRLEVGHPPRNEPVLSAPADAVKTSSVSRPAVVWDPVRKLLLAWYATRVEYSFSIRHAVSVDGRAWAPFPENPVLQPGETVWCDDEYLDAPWVRLAPSGALQLWYHGRSATLGHGICLAENRYHD